MEGESHSSVIDTTATPACATDQPSEHDRKGRGRPRRTIPEDFEMKFAELGYSEALKELYGVNTQMLTRWCNEHGWNKLDLARLHHRGAGWSIRRRSRRKNYVLGRRLGS